MTFFECVPLILAGGKVRRSHYDRCCVYLSVKGTVVYYDPEYDSGRGREFPFFMNRVNLTSSDWVVANG